MATTSATAVLIGEQFSIDITISANPGDTVEIDRAAESWGPVEVVVVNPGPATEAGARSFTVTVAAFAPGPLVFQPAVLVTAGGAVEQRLLPEVALTVESTLAEDAPLDVSPVAPPEAASGAQSRLLVPALITGGVVAAVAITAAAAFAMRLWLKRRPPHLPAPAPPSEPIDALAEAERLLDTDFVNAYRLLATSFRTSVGDQFGLPAPALTSAEIEQRMTAAGVDPWLGRLSREVLAACDAVVYGGYRPAAERRHADFAMARRVVESAEGAG